jgi:hypothetical protein
MIKIRAASPLSNNTRQVITTHEIIPIVLTFFFITRMTYSHTAAVKVLHSFCM